MLIIGKSKEKKDELQLSITNDEDGTVETLDLMDWREGHVVGEYIIGSWVIRINCDKKDADGN